MKVTIVSWYGGRAIGVFANASTALERAKVWCLVRNNSTGDPSRVVVEMGADGDIRVGWRPDNPNVAIQWNYTIGPYTVRET